jgi:excinuclease ABC subunit A
MLGRVAVKTRQRMTAGAERAGANSALTRGDVPWLTVRQATHHNLKHIDVRVPLGRFTCVTGVSGSGKSSLVNDILYKALARDLNGATTLEPGPHAGIDGGEQLDKVIAIDQSPIGRTPRSNPATYVKVFDEIRALFTKLPDAKLRGYKPGRFSFNVPSRRGGGRCEACEGNGANRIEMDFLADVWVTCPVCEGHRFSHGTLQIHYKGKCIADVLEMEVGTAIELFENVPRIRGMLQTLHDVGLDYVQLGQPSTTLSGGEAQRIKLARELVKKGTGRTLYVLDEPTTGLHFDDIRKLLAVLHGFVDAANTVIVIEHNLDVVKTADWIIDLGPEGGDAGGYIVAEGTPEDVAACAASYTGQALKEVLSQKSEVRSQKSEGGAAAPGARGARTTSDFIIHTSDFVTVVGARQHNLKDLTVSFPRERMTVCTGVSGSGKTSFAIDTVFTEGYRRYVESLSAYARQFLGQMAKPRVDHVDGLSPAICIEQRAAGKSPRSTVGTVTEIYDYMRVLWARVGTRYCPQCLVPIGTQTADEVVDRVMALEAGAPIVILAPISLGDGETYAGMFNRLKNSGYLRVRIDGEIRPTAEATTLDARRKHRVEVVIDRTVVRAKSRARIAESVEHALALGGGVMALVVEEVETVEESDEATERRSDEGAVLPGQSTADTADTAVAPVADELRTDPATAVRVKKTPAREFMYSQKLVCTKCGTSYEELGPNHFSFNSPLGWCETCEGLGVQRGAPAAAIIDRPNRSLFEGAVAGWDRIERRSPLGRMLLALCTHLDVPPDTPLRDWTPEQKRALMFGTDGWLDGSDAYSGVRFQWRGFFPGIDHATRNSWTFRYKLRNVVTDIPCVTCRGGRLRPDAAAVRLSDRTIVEVCDMPLDQCAEFFRALRLDERERKIAGELLKEIRDRLQFLIDVGLSYLTLHRAAPTLAGGEAQRIRLASQIGSGLTGVLYVLDEPTIGLHPRDTARLIAALAKLRDLGNTLLLVEHDRDVIRSADRLLDFGPRAGNAGGRIVAEGPPGEFLARTEVGSQKSEVAATGPPIGESLTRAYLNGATAIPIPSNRRPAELDPALLKRDEKAEGRRDEGRRRGRRGPAQLSTPPWLVVRGARQHNLKDIDVPIPLGRLVCVTGVSGSGKSSLVNDILWPVAANELHGANLSAGEHDCIDGLDQIQQVVNVDQAPIGSTPSSNPATYTGVFDWIRELFTRLPESKLRGYSANRFSFNRPGGRCEACEGYGQRCIEMHFMPDVWVECETCHGRRYNPETLEVRFKGKNIADVLDLRVTEALVLFENVPKVRRMLQTLADVGLDYVQLGQPAPTLSGGEAQRVKLATELGKPDTGHTLYLLDEPTTGLHFDDIRKLLTVLHRLADLGNTVLVVEHNLDVLKCADWIIDLGPEAGDAGGYVVAMGTPEGITSAKLRVQSAGATVAPLSPLAREPGISTLVGTQHSALSTRSHTAAALAPVLAAGPYEERTRYDPAEHAAREIAVARAGLGKIGREVPVPWQVDGRKWHLEQRSSRDATPRRWEPAALEYVVDLVQRAGRGVGRASRPSAFEPTNWNSQASVEITAPGAPTWFLHALTGGEWLLELYFRTPPGLFKWRELDDELGLKTLDEREDLETYGDWARVDVRSRRDGLDAVVIYVHDKAEIDTPAFRRFIKRAAKAYLGAVGSFGAG